MRVAALCLAATLLPSSAQAQWLSQDGDEIGDSGASPDKTANRNYTTPGASQVVASKLLSAMRLQQRERDLCWELGCVVILNASKTYRIESFFVGEQRRGRLVWSRNQFGKPLLPRRATFRFKMDGENCERPVRFVFRDPQTKEALNVDDRVNFCPTPRVDSLLKLNVLRPRVIVEQPD